MLRHLRTVSPLLFGVAVFLTGIFIADWTGLYDNIPHVDKVFHVAGGLAVAWAAMAFLQDDIRRIPWHKQALFIISVACLVGVLWEFLEYISNGTRYTYPVVYHYLHGGDLTDTLGDLLADIVGGVFFALWVGYKEKN